MKKLTPYVIDGEDDKVILPESCIVDLSNLDVFGKGPILMRLSKEDIEDDQLFDRERCAVYIPRGRGLGWLWWGTKCAPSRRDSSFL